MENKIPLPTDNIFKFYALFGILLVIFNLGAAIYLNNSSNDFSFQVAVEYETLNANPVRSLEQEVRFKMINKKLMALKTDKRFYMSCLSILFTIGLVMLLYGFKKWHTEIQPVQDEIAKLNIEKLKLEIEKLKTT